ncbi:hypothetical protein QUF49_01465 [Fictibacillus sp. b24]|uniref:hypothetical protein n=1 Tax=Fictibacillus sp. b24 TaxID=3055863 RepID=UPI0025A2C8C8|nr:hypothetical protein [Fictibacillus sp. b24]MDM5314638.1 hypothetical protein [Fictibacillus sp. b24]
MGDSCGTSGQVRPLKEHSGKGLTACPAESEHLKRKSTAYMNKYLQEKIDKTKKDVRGKYCV